MSLEEHWNEALKRTEIVRLPVKRLLTFGVSQCDYIFLAPSVVNQGDTVVRKGKIDIDRPNIIMPDHRPDFEGFNSEDTAGIKDEQLRQFFYVRGISFPSLKYRNEPYELDLYEGSVNAAEKVYLDKVRTQENVSTGIVIGVDAAWQFSVILLACHMIDTHIDNDLKAILNHIKKRK